MEVKEFEGKELEGIICKHPFLDRDSKVVLGSDDTIVVELGTGTGCVHCAPSYGKEDYLLGLKHNSEVIVTVDSKGVQRGEGSGPFKDMYYAKSDKEIIKWLEENKIGKKTTNYRLREWIFARQRYWGEPIPVIELENGELISLSDEDLPLILPELKDYKPSKSGASPLEKAENSLLKSLIVRRQSALQLWRCCKPAGYWRPGIHRR